MLLYSSSYSFRQTITEVPLDTKAIDTHNYEDIQKYSKAPLATNDEDVSGDLVTSACPAYATTTFTSDENKTEGDYELIGHL